MKREWKKAFEFYTELEIFSSRIRFSRSWESIKKVRKMHQFASRASCAKGYMNISQAAMSMTAFGFMGYALIRPHLLGIHVKREEDREDFVYFWAVIGSMLGMKDEFNMCLHPIDVVEQYVFDTIS
jgi:hypothetical protein